jgi:hypothetical protein
MAAGAGAGALAHNVVMTLVVIAALIVAAAVAVIGAGP